MPRAEVYRDTDGARALLQMHDFRDCLNDLDAAGYPTAAAATAMDAYFEHTELLIDERGPGGVDGTGGYFPIPHDAADVVWPAQRGPVYHGLPSSHQECGKRMVFRGYDGRVHLILPNYGWDPAGPYTDWRHAARLAFTGREYEVTGSFLALERQHPDITKAPMARVGRRVEEQLTPDRLARTVVRKVFRLGD